MGGRKREGGETVTARSRRSRRGPQHDGGDCHKPIQRTCTTRVFDGVARERLRVGEGGNGMLDLMKNGKQEKCKERQRLRQLIAIYRGMRQTNNN